MSNGLSQEAALVGKITEYQSSVKSLVGTEEEPVNFNLLTPGVYVFQGYLSITVAGKTTTNTKACPKELLLVREVVLNRSIDEARGLTFEMYIKIGYLFHTDFDESIFGNVMGAGVLACELIPSSYKFIGEWPEDEKKAMIEETESGQTFDVMWIDNWFEESSGDYATRDYVDSAVTDMATQTYVNEAISSAIGGLTFPSEMATQTYVNEAIDTKLGVIENGPY